MSRTSIADIVKFSESLRLLCEKYNITGYGFRIYGGVTSTDLDEIKLLPKSLIRSGYFYVKFLPDRVWQIDNRQIPPLSKDSLEDIFLENMLSYTFGDGSVLQ